MRYPSCFLLLAGSFLLCASGAKADVLFDWNFDESAGTVLSRTSNTGSLGGANWTDDIGHSSTTGEGSFRIQRAIGGNTNSYVWNFFPDVTWLVVDLDGWALSDQEGGFNEDIRFGFSHNVEPLNQYAEIQLARLASANQMYIRGVAGLVAEGAEAIPPIPTGLSNIEERPVRLVLKIEQSANLYSIYYNIDETGYVHVGTGNLDPNRQAVALRFHAINSFADRLDPTDSNSPVEFVDVDRIFVTTEDPVGDNIIPGPAAEVPEERITHNWDFNEAEGTSFSGTINSLGEQTWRTYSGDPADDIGGSFTTGDGAMRIRRAIGGPMNNLVYLDRQWAGKQWFVIDFRGWNLTGNVNETLQFGFLENYTTGAISMAHVRLRRIAPDAADAPANPDPDRFYLMGRAFDGAYGATLTAEEPVFPIQQDEPVRIVLEYDHETGGYAIYYRIAEGDYIFFADGQTDLRYGPNALWMYATNSFAEDGEYVDIERIFVTAANPMTEDPGEPTEGYAAWAAQYFSQGGPDSEPNADPDGDGFSNLLEYAFASDPLAADRGIAPVVTGDGDYLELIFRRNLSADDLSYSVEASADLEDWVEIAAAEGTADFVSLGSSGIQVTADDGFERVTVGDSVAIDGESRRFLRLQVSGPGMN